MINPKSLNTDEKYFSNKNYMSVSLWKKFNRCEELGTEPFSSPTEAMLVGSYVDSWVEGTLDEFIAKNPQIISSRGATKGQLKSAFKIAEQIIRHIENSETLKQFLSGEKQTVMTGKIQGVPFKIKMDSYAKDIAITDLKIMSTITDSRGNYIDFISQWGYHYQGAVYQEICYQNTGVRLPFFIEVITKENPINSAIIQIPQEILDTALNQVKENVVRYWNIYNGKENARGCGICATCIKKREDTPIISMYEIMKI